MNSKQQQLSNSAATSYPPVKTKHEFVRRYLNGEFGNRAPTWATYESWQHDRDTLGRRQLYHVRNRVPDADTWYNVKISEMHRVWNEAIDIGHKAADLYISAMAPTERTVIQGEVVKSERYIDLGYSNVRKPMRDALADKTEFACGVIALEILRHSMNGASFDWLQTLFDRYPDHVVEFSVYSVEWGTVPGHNTVFWEVRSY